MNGLNYLLQSNLYLILFFGLYWLVLKNETFNNLNRAYLLGSALISFMIPIWNFNFVKSWFLTQKTSDAINTVTLPIISQKIGLNEYSPMEYLSYVYISVCILLAIKLLSNIFNVYRYLNENQTLNKAFSFFNTIIINSEADPDDVIYNHERVHASHYHSFDVLLFEIIGIFCWFNPIVYAYKIAVKNIHEFIADDIASQQLGSKAMYAMLLFSEQFQTHPSVLVNNFFTKTSLKLRIKMLNKIKSKKTAILKYGFIAPLFLAMLVFASANINGEKLDKIFTQNNSENIGVSGIILNENQKPVVGANVILLGTTKGTSSNLDGKFSLQSLPENGEIVITHIGYKSITMKLSKNRNDLLFRMERQITQLNGATVTALSSNLLVDMENTETPKKMPSDTITNEEIFSVVEKQAEFPGGLKALGKYLQANLRYPAEAQKNNITGKVFVSFVVGKTGNISNIRILKGLSHGINEEAIRVTAQMPRWEPAQQSGRLVNSQFNMPIQFLLEGGTFQKMDESNLIKSSETDQNPWSEVGKLGITYEKAIFLLNGIVISREKAEAIDFTKILRIDVSKGDDAIKKFGEKAKNCLCGE